MIKLYSNAINLSNKKFGKLTVLIPVFTNRYGVYWRCKCDCGTIKNILASKLIRGKTKSCGCLQKEIMQKRNQKGKNNSNYKDGTSLKQHYCIICKINPISYNNWLYGKKQCKKCYYKTLKGSGNPRFIDDRTNNNKCKCGKRISKYSKQCMTCWNKLSLTYPHKVKRLLGKNNPFFGKKHTKKTKKLLKKINKGRNNPQFGKKPTIVKKLKYKNILMRSSWEVAYAKYLDRKDIKWLYEPKTFDLGKYNYTPDFYLPKTDEWIEIKGRWYKESLKRFKKFIKLFKSINIKVISQKELRDLKLI
jgi:hypothetical protein